MQESTQTHMTLITVLYIFDKYNDQEDTSKHSEMQLERSKLVRCLIIKSHIDGILRVVRGQDPFSAFSDLTDKWESAPHFLTLEPTIFGVMLLSHALHYHHLKQNK